MRGIFLILVAGSLHAQVRLSADGLTDAYDLIDKALGGTAHETPDCSHKDFGPHITQMQDAGLGAYAFVFHIHEHADNDRCTGFDRQRTEIKTFGPSPGYLKGLHGDSVNFRWKVRLDANFQPSPNFTHIHQIKPGDGDASLPIITLTARTGQPETLEAIHVDSKHKTQKLATVPLEPFKGRWIEAYEWLTYGHVGAYSLVLTDLRSGKTLLEVHTDRIDLWRDKTTFARPKWGIYRSLRKREYLRDEDIEFAGFCLAKGTDDCE